MERSRKKVWIALTLGVVLIGFLLITHYRAKGRLDSYRQQLIAQGEKLDIAELSPPEPEPERNGAFVFMTRRGLNIMEYPTAMKMVAPGRARVVWREANPFDEYSEKAADAETDSWSALRAELARHEYSREEMRDALQLPEFHFHLDYQQGFSLLLPHIASLKGASQHLAAAALLELHEGAADDAFANLLACVALPVRYKNEPLLISQLVRMAMTAIAVTATWEALQYPGWTEEQLLELQQAWESFDAFDTAEESLAMERAMGAGIFDMARGGYGEFRQLMDMQWAGAQPSFRENVEEMTQALVEDPVQALKALGARFPGYWLWKWWWSYDDERYLLGHWQQGIEAVRAARVDPFADVLQEWERAATEPDARLIMSSMLIGVSGKYISRLVGAQTQRDMAVTAIALKRFHLRHTRHPAQLNELVPDYLSRVPRDLWDGQPLRYRPREDGGFLLYAVGTNATDDGGNPDGTSQSSRPPSWTQALDWVWPQPATPGEVKLWEQSHRQRGANGE